MMQKPKYEVAVLEDGKIVKIYPQEQYNQAIIEQYRGNLNYDINSSQAPSAPVYTDPAQNLNEASNSFEQQSQTMNAQTSHIEQVGQKVVKPFQTMAYTIGIGLFISLAIAVAYQTITGKKLGKAFFGIMQAITFLIAFAIFLNSLK